MTNRLKRLEDQGLVARRPDPSNGRIVLVALTSRGRRLVDDAGWLTWRRWTGCWAVQRS